MSIDSIKNVTSNYAIMVQAQKEAPVHDPNFYATFGSMWHDASVHNIETGCTSGINQQEYDEMMMYLYGQVECSEENRDAAIELVRWLELLRDCPNNQDYVTETVNSPQRAWEIEQVESDRPSLIERIFNIDGAVEINEQIDAVITALQTEDVIDYDTMLHFGRIPDFEKAGEEIVEYLLSKVSSGIKEVSQQ